MSYVPATLGGDVTGAATATTVTKIRGRAIAQPGASEDFKVPQYQNGGTSFAWVSIATICPIGVWGVADVSALTTSDVESPNAWSQGSQVIGVQMPAAGAIEWLDILTSGDVGAVGQNLTVTVYKNGVATALSGTLSGGAGTETKLLQGVQVTFNQADLITVQAKRVSTPNAVSATFTLFGWFR
jgi:hypothetical protein